MNSSGVLLVLAGSWVIVQVIGGDAQGRLGVGSDWSHKTSGQQADPVPIPGSPMPVSTSATSRVGVGTWA